MINFSKSKGGSKGGEFEFGSSSAIFLEPNFFEGIREGRRGGELGAKRG